MIISQNLGEGFTTGISLIIAIGAQNSYVLKKGIEKKYVFITVLICTLIDILLISTGTLGLGVVITRNKFLMLGSSIFGSLFLTYYGINSIKGAFKRKSLEVKGGEDETLKKTVVTILSLTLLNPHVYLDTMVLIGSIGGKLPLQEKLSYIVGASLASFVWFFGIGYGARLLQPIFKKSITWVVLDTFIGVIMFYIAIKLILFIV